MGELAVVGREQRPLCDGLGGTQACSTWKSLALHVIVRLNLFHTCTISITIPFRKNPSYNPIIIIKTIIILIRSEQLLHIVIARHLT